MTSSSAPGIFRILLEVRDLDQSRRFYESLLGTRGRAVGGGRVYFDCGRTILAILSPSLDDSARIRPAPEPVYFSTRDLPEVYRRARRLGCLSQERIHGEDPAGEIRVRPWGERSFYASDPSGNPLCFVDSRTRFTGTARQIAALDRVAAPSDPRQNARARSARPVDRPLRN